MTSITWRNNRAFIWLDLFVEGQQHPINEQFREKKVFAAVKGARPFHCSTRYAVFCWYLDFGWLFVFVLLLQRNF